MSKCQDLSEALAQLETFNPAAFRPDRDHPEEVCAFVLALAAIYDDFKDLLLADRLLLSERPPGPPAETAAWGQYNGFRNYITRLMAGLLHELMKIVKANESVISYRAFVHTIKRLNPEGRASWAAIVAVALSKPCDDPLAKALVLIRNKVSFHYDCKQILRGYNLRFPATNGGNVPYISRGNTLLSTRFYFADAASQSYLSIYLETDDVRKEFGPDSKLITQVNTALHEIVVSFIQNRGYAWRSIRSCT